MSAIIAPLVEFGKQVMTQSTQGLIIALLISLLIGVIIGFYLRQSRINDLANALKQQQKRTEDIEQEHQRRLQEATAQLQRDYENQLADKIELYQAQYNEQLTQLDAEYEARLSMMGSGYQGANLGAPMAGDVSQETAAAIEQRIRKQYETRLKEAAQKIQQAYEHHLKDKLSETREALQKDYEQRLAEKIEHYQDQLEEKLAQATAVSSLTLGSEADPYTEAFPVGAVVPMAEASSPQQDVLKDELRAEYEQKLAEKIEHYQDDLAKRIEELEQEYEARFRMVQATQQNLSETIDPAQDQVLRAELEEHLKRDLENRFKQDYDQRLAQAIERYQDEMVQRTQELEQEYEARLQLVRQQYDQASQSPSAPLAEASPPDDQPLFKNFESDLSPELPAPPAEEIPFGFDAAITATIEDALFSDTAPGDNLVNELAFDLDQKTSTQPAALEGLDIDLSPSTQPPTAPVKTNELDLDELLTLGQGDAFPTDQIPLDDSGFDLDNLEALLNAQDDDDSSENLFDNLDDLSNLS